MLWFEGFIKQNACLTTRELKVIFSLLTFVSFHRVFIYWLVGSSRCEEGLGVKRLARTTRDPSKVKSFTCVFGRSNSYWLSVNWVWKPSDFVWTLISCLFVLSTVLLCYIYLSWTCIVYTFPTVCSFCLVLFHSPSPFLMSVILRPYCKLLHIFSLLLVSFVRQKSSHLGATPTRLAFLFWCIPRRFEINVWLNLSFMGFINQSNNGPSGMSGEEVIDCFSCLFLVWTVSQLLCSIEIGTERKFSTVIVFCMC